MTNLSLVTIVLVVTTGCTVAITDYDIWYQNRDINEDKIESNEIPEVSKWCQRSNQEVRQQLCMNEYYWNTRCLRLECFKGFNQTCTEHMEGDPYDQRCANDFFCDQSIWRCRSKNIDILETKKIIDAILKLQLGAGRGKRIPVFRRSSL